MDKSVKFFELAEIAKFTPQQVRNYEDSLKSYRDIKNSIDTAREERTLASSYLKREVIEEKNKALADQAKLIEELIGKLATN